MVWTGGGGEGGGGSDGDGTAAGFQEEAKGREPSRPSAGGDGRLWGRWRWRRKGEEGREEKEEVIRYRCLSGACVSALVKPSEETFSRILACGPSLLIVTVQCRGRCEVRAM